MREKKLSQRIWAYVGLKAIGSTLAITAFFVAYFYVINHPVFPVRVMPILGPDYWMPLLPWTAWVYFSLWVYICLPSSLMQTPQALGHYLLGSFGLSVLGLLIFVIFPTAVPNWEFDWSPYPSLAFLKESDASGNACPSLHVGFAVFAGLWLSAMLRSLRVSGVWHWWNTLWCGAIVLSTMTTKQHVFIDVVCGAILGACVYWGNQRWLRRMNSTL
jgi:hypothetical protein